MTRLLSTVFTTSVASLVLAACGGADGSSPLPSVDASPVSATRSAYIDAAVIPLPSPTADADLQAQVQARIADPRVVRYCIEANDPFLRSATLRRSDGSTVWRHQLGEPCTGGQVLPAGDYTLVVSYRTTYATPYYYLPAFLRRADSTAAEAQAWLSSRNCVQCDLHTAWMYRLDLTQANLSGVNLRAMVGLSGSYFTGANLTGADLSGVDLGSNAQAWRGANFTNADLRRSTSDGLDFSQSRLLGADLREASLRNANFQGQRLLGNRFDAADLRGARFDGATLGCVNLHGAQLAQSSFSSAALQCVDLRESDLTGSRFSSTLALPGLQRGLPRADLPGCAGIDFSNAQTDATGLTDQVPCGGALMGKARITANAPPAASWRHLDLTQAVLVRADNDPPADLRSLDLRNGRFDGMAFSGANLEAADFSGASLRGADLSLARLAGATLRSSDLSCFQRGPGDTVCTALRGANLRGALLAYANTTGADFSQATFNANPSAVAGAPDATAANLSYLYGPNSRFDDADLTGVNLANAQVYGPLVSFRRSNLVRANLSHGIYSSVDFSLARLAGTKFSNANLVGARLSLANLGLDNGEPTSFSGAYLHGADFTQTDAYGTDFTGATVSLARGTLQVTRLVAPGQLGVVTVGFDATVLPLNTNTSTTCPLGSRGPCTGTAWQTVTPREPTCVPSLDQWCPPDAQTPVAP